MHVCVCVCAHAHADVYVYAYAYIRVYVYVYVYVCVYDTVYMSRPATSSPVRLCSSYDCNDVAMQSCHASWKQNNFYLLFLFTEFATPCGLDTILVAATSACKATWALRPHGSRTKSTFLFFKFTVRVYVCACVYYARRPFHEVKLSANPLLEG